MFTILRNIFNLLRNFGDMIATAIRYVGDFFRGIWTSFGYLRDCLALMPSGIAALGMLCLVVAVIYLILGR